MTNISIYNAMPASLTEAMNIAKMFAESGMFTDVKGAAQALVKIQAGAEMGIPPFASMSGVHIIKGKPTVGAGLMASRVKASGKYDYRVLEQTETICKIEFFQLEGKKKDTLGVSEFTLKDAEKAGTQNLSKFPRNMLFARAMSNGVKWYCPDVFSGPVYVPEEMETIDTSHVEGKEQPKQIEARPVDQKALDAQRALVAGLLDSRAFDNDKRSKALANIEKASLSELKKWETNLQAAIRKAEANGVSSGQMEYMEELLDNELFLEDEKEVAKTTMISKTFHEAEQFLSYLENVKANKMYSAMEDTEQKGAA
jgi:hypothetical protein